MTSSPLILQQILDQAQRHNQDAKGHFISVFDLDSTLFDVNPRVARILNDFSQIDAMRALYPEACGRLAEPLNLKSTYQLRDQISHLGLRDQPQEFYATLFEFWKKRFFSNDYLKFDQPYPGAVDFVGRLESLGSEIIYLTGRDVDRMGPGSEASLRACGFPLHDRATLALKPHMDLDDAEFKRDFLMQLPRDLTEIWFFENEPVNIELVLREVNHVRVVFFESVHMEKAEPPPPHIPRIRRF